MSSNCLQLVQQATGELGLTVPTYVVGNPAQDQVQQLALLNAVGNELQREFIWQHSTVQYRVPVAILATTGDVVNGSAVITNLASTAGIDNKFQVSGVGIPTNANVVSVDSPTQITIDQPATATTVGNALNFGQVRFPLPANFDRSIDTTQWDITKKWQLLGPATAQQWEYLVSGWIATGPRAIYRLWAGYFQIWPVQTTPDLLGFEYISNSWVVPPGGFEPLQSSFLLDTDTCVFPDRLMVLGLKKKYYEAKGFDTTALSADYESQKSIAFANDQGPGTLSMAPRAASNLIGWWNIPDSSYGAGPASF